MGILDMLQTLAQQRQQQQDYQGLLSSMFQGAPPTSINVTPQISMPSSPLLMQPPQPQASPPSPNIAAAQAMAPDVAAAVQPQLNANAASGAYDVNRQPGAVAPLMQGPQASILQNVYSHMHADVGMPPLLLLQQQMQQQMGPKTPQVVGKDSRLVVPDGQGGFKTVLEAGAQDAMSPLGKLAADFKAGRISQSEYDAGVAKETYAPGQGAESALGKLASDLKAGRISKADYDAAVAKETRLPQEAPTIDRNILMPILQKQLNKVPLTPEEKLVLATIKPPQGDFGRSMEGKSYNILAQGLKDPATRATPEYATAWQILSNPKLDPATGTLVIPDLSQFLPPTGGQAPSVPAQGGTSPPPGAAPPQRMPNVQSFAPPNPSQAEAQSAGFANRLDAANQIFDDPKVSDAAQSYYSNAASGVPVIGNAMAGSDYQQFDQAQRNFINAQLRRESGAVISPGEFADARKQYLPQPGDNPEVLKQKKASRDMAVRNMQLSAGNTLLGPGQLQEAGPPRGVKPIPQSQGFGSPIGPQGGWSVKRVN